MEMEKKNVALIILVVALVASGVGNIIMGVMLGGIQLVPPQERVLTYVDTATPYVLDPVDCWDAYSGLIIEQCAETLFTYNYSDNGQNMVLIPLLATGYTYDDTGDHPVYTLTLREDVYFHDGTLWNATVCEWNFDRMDYWWNLTGNTPGDVVLGYPEYVYHFADGVQPLWNRTEITGEFEFEIHMTDPYTAFIDLITYTAMSMLSPNSFPGDETGTDAFLPFNGDIIGTGPFDFEYYRDSVETRFTRFDDYWGGPTYWDEAVIIYFEDSVSMNNAMLAGQYDFMEGCLPDLITTFRASTIVDYVNFTALYGDLSFGYGYVGINCPNIDPEVREAMNWATDQLYLKNEILEGVVEPAKTPVPGTFFGSKDSYECFQNFTEARRILYAYDPGTFPSDLNDDAAWQAVAATGTYNYSIWKYTPSQTYQEYFVTFQAWFELIGINLYKIETYWGTFIGMMNLDPNSFDMWPIGWIPDYLNALNMLAPLFHPESTATFTRYENPTVTAWLEAAFSETDSGTLLTLFHNIQDQLFAPGGDFPHIPLDYGQLFYIKVPELVVPNYNAGQRLYFADWFKV
jgi:peptide/nickel transport system substrate-binding protein